MKPVTLIDPLSESGSTSFPIAKPYFFSSVLTTEAGTLGFFLLSCFFLRFSLFFGLLSPMASFSLHLIGMVFGQLD